SLYLTKLSIFIYTYISSLLICTSSFDFNNSSSIDSRSLCASSVFFKISATDCYFAEVSLDSESFDLDTEESELHAASNNKHKTINNTKNFLIVPSLSII